MIGILFASLLASASSVQAANARRDPAGPLQFDENGNFQIAIFEDLHFGENAWDQWGPQQDIHSVKVLNKVLDFDRPDLVVLNGDLITGENAYFENATVYVDMIVGPMVERGLPWASTYGNHDHTYNTSGVGILARERQWPNSLTKQMVPDREAGVSNYYLPVYAANCTSCHCAPKLLLWFFDSRGGSHYREKNADMGNWVHESVVQWFKNTNAKFVKKFKTTIPSIGFVHIPITAALALQKSGVNPNTEPGINDDGNLSSQGQGWCADGTHGGSCTYGGQDVPFMEAITSTPGFMAVFSGHDHGDTWCYKWNGVLPDMTVDGKGLNICFGQHSGYGGYGNWIRGARQVYITEEKLENLEFDTWIRLESGNAVGSVSLNSTYGDDLYPVTPNDKTGCPTCDWSVITPGPR